MIRESIVHPQTGVKVNIKQPHLILYHPDIPNKLELVFEAGPLYKLYSQGYKKISLVRIGHLLRKFRKNLGISTDEMVDKLEDNGVFISKGQLQQLETEKCKKHSFLSVAALTALAQFFYLTVSDLVKH